MTNEKLSRHLNLLRFISEETRQYPEPQQTLAQETLDSFKKISH